MSNKALDNITARLNAKRKLRIFASDDAFDCTEKVYPFSNENTYEVMGKYDMKGKRVLTVGSSGDQVLNAVLLRAGDITLIDSNPLAEPYTELKIAAIKNLTMSETYEFLTRRGILKQTTYDKIKDSLSPTAREFWDGIYALPWDKKRKFILEFAHINFDLRGKDTNKYLTDTASFLELRKNLQEARIHYVDADLFDFHTKTHGTFDYIFLSNIFDHVKDHDAFFSEVTTLGKTKLRKNGKLQVNYDFIEGLSIDYFKNAFKDHYGNDAVKSLELQNVFAVPFHSYNNPFAATTVMLSKSFFDKLPENYKTAGKSL